MKLYEYQAKELFGESGIEIPRSRILTRPDDTDFSMENLRAGMQDLLTYTGVPCMVKSQLFIGGRGKAGLVKFAATEDEAITIASELFSRTDYHVTKLMIEEAVSIKNELYLSVTVDPVSASGLIMASAEGGVEIEKLAKENPQAIIRRSFDIRKGLEVWQARQLAFDLELHGHLNKQFSELLIKLTGLFCSYDAELVEINPLFVTEADQLVAGDGKFTIDDNSTFRQKRFEPDIGQYENELDREAAQEGIPFLQFDGDISLMCAGAGLTTTVYDLIHYEGGTVSNYLEFGGPNYHKAMKAMEICLKTDSKVILIVTFGTIARADVMAKGVVDAIERLQPDRPIVTCIRGTNEEEAVTILKKAGLEPIFDTEEAVRKAVELSQV
jgi:succinyl-CoA synthetase beta subunit